MLMIYMHLSILTVLVTSVNLTLTSLISRCPTPSWISLRTRITNPGITDERIPSAVIEKERRTDDQ